MQPIGTIRGYQVPGKMDTYKLTRLAVTKEYRKYGFGRKLVEALHQWIRSHAEQSNIVPTALENTQPNPQILSKTNPVSICTQK
jgi:GNAT superfamily N-acetyltransferase